MKHAILVKVDEADLDKWKELSGGNLSAWIRSRCNAGIEPQVQAKEERLPQTPTSVKKATQRSLACEHGAMKGLCKRGCK